MADSLLLRTKKNLKAVIPRLDRGIHKKLDAPIKSEHDMFHLYSCRDNNLRIEGIAGYLLTKPLWYIFI